MTRVLFLFIVVCVVTPVAYGQESGLLRVEYPNALINQPSGTWVGEEFVTRVSNSFCAFKPSYDNKHPGRRVVWNPDEQQHPFGDLMRLAGSNEKDQFGVGTHNKAHVVELTSGRIVNTESLDSGDEFAHVLLDRSGRQLLYLTEPSGNECNSVLCVRNLASNRISTHNFAAECIDSIAFSSNGRLCATASSQRIAVFDCPQLELLKQCRINKSISGGSESVMADGCKIRWMHFMKEDSILVCVGLVSLFFIEVESGMICGEWMIPNPDPNVPRYIDASATSKGTFYLALGANPGDSVDVRKLSVADMKGIGRRSLADLFQHRAEFMIDSMRLSPDGKWLASLAHGSRESELVFLPLTNNVE